MDAGATFLASAHLHADAFHDAYRIGLVALGLDATLGDLNGDGAVDGADVGILLANWGPNAGGAAVGDLNNDGVVDGGDLGAMLVAWTG